MIIIRQIQYNQLSLADEPLPHFYTTIVVLNRISFYQYNGEIVQMFCLINKLNHLLLLEIKDSQQPNTITKAPRIEMDSKDFGIGAQILHDLNIRKLKLISNSKQTKRVGMIGYGLEIIDYVNY